MRTAEVVGECPLTQGELRVLRLLMEGLTYEEIAASLNRSPSTVRSQLHSAYRRLGVATSYQAVLTCVREGWLTWDDGDPERAILMRIEDLFRHLVLAVESRQEREREQLTDSQRQYLAAFDRHLQARAPGERVASRAQMDTALVTMLDEAEVPVPTGRGDDDVISNLGELLDSSLDQLDRLAA